MKKIFYDEFSLDDHLAESEMHILEEDINYLTQVKSLQPNLMRIPEPFFGNTINPSILVLSPYPFDDEESYNEEKTNNYYKKTLYQNLKHEGFNYLSRVTTVNMSVRIWPHQNSYRWDKLFANVKTIFNNQKQWYPYFESLIGVFHYYPYRLKKNSQIKETVNDFPSQERIIGQINDILGKVKPIVVILDDKNIWKMKVSKKTIDEAIFICSGEALTFEDSLSIFTRLKKDYNEQNVFISKHQTAYMTLKAIEPFEKAIKQMNKLEEKNEMKVGLTLAHNDEFDIVNSNPDLQRLMQDVMDSIVNSGVDINKEVDDAKLLFNVESDYKLSTEINNTYKSLIYMIHENAMGKKFELDLVYLLYRNLKKYFKDKKIIGGNK